ncbi:Cytochrome c oxidase assembly factor 6 [Perkinsus olseni]|uniref:Cytochrome c oxidase assembly factor 6 n=1 Tax=Perkinsus olseni TaxID=32597 RepID=A0A7J6MX01_PEROL|nr:Cytochrome c oxidase assembly factor 6 [Perkinsus olseni]
MDPRSTSPPEATVKGVARREKCWKARDDFFQCLTDNNEDEGKCRESKETFHSDCLPTWVKHFTLQRQVR